MTAEPQSLRAQLVASAASYRHVHEEHRRARPGGHTRRHLDARLKELAADFERLLADAAVAGIVREQWRQHFYRSSAEPDLPTAEPASPPTAHRPPRNRDRGTAPLWQR